VNAPRTNRAEICPECGATTVGPADECWLCHRPLARSAGAPEHAPAAAAAVEPAGASAAMAHAAQAEQRAGFQFGLASLMLVTTLVAVICGVTAMAPGLGIALAIVVVPALVLTAVSSARHEAAGHAMTTSAKMERFAAAFGVTLITLVAAGAAFFGTCFVGFFGGALASQGLGQQARGAGEIWGLVIGSILGGAAALIVFIRVFRHFLRSLSPKKSDDRNPSDTRVA
jgi:hypothetical protein